MTQFIPSYTYVLCFHSWRIYYQSVYIPPKRCRKARQWSQTSCTSDNKVCRQALGFRHFSLSHYSCIQRTLANKLTSTRKGEIIVDNQVWFVHAAFKLHSLCYFITVWFFDCIVNFIIIIKVNKILLVILKML